MNTLTMGKAHTLDPDYEAFSGRVVNTFTTTYYDPKAKAWIKRTVEYIDVGRPQRVEPVDTETAMTPDPWERTPINAAANAVNARRSQEFHSKIQADVTAYLTKYGPTHCGQLARDLDLSYRTLNKHLLMNTNTVYARLGKSLNPVIWGLVGVHDKEAA